jgi:hypothetical protein
MVVAKVRSGLVVEVNGDGASAKVAGVLVASQSHVVCGVNTRGVLWV